MASSSTTIYPDTSEDSDSDSGTDTTGELRPPSAKTRRYSGAAKYKTTFNRAWTKEFPCITCVVGDRSRYSN